MNIFLPKTTSENSQTGAPKSEWEAIEHASHTQREAIVAFETYISVLSQKLKDIDTTGSDLGIRVNSIEKAVDKIERLSDKTFQLVVIGFIALIVVVIIGLGGFLFGYLQVINDNIAKNDYKYNFTNIINDQKIETEKLQNTILSLEKENKILSNKINCTKGKKYWQYEQCFE